MNSNENRVIYFLLLLTAIVVFYVIQIIIIYNRTPSVPVVPVTPSVPVTPTDPSVPIQPIGPLQPIRPITPSVPVQPIGPLQPVRPINPSIPVVPINPSIPVVPINPSVPIVPIIPPSQISPADCRKKDASARSCKNLGVNLLRTKDGKNVVCPPGFELDENKRFGVRCRGVTKTVIDPRKYKVCDRKWPNIKYAKGDAQCRIGGISTDGNVGQCQIGPKRITFWLTNPTPYSYFCGKL